LIYWNSSKRNKHPVRPVNPEDLNLSFWHGTNALQATARSFNTGPALITQVNPGKYAQATLATSIPAIAHARFAGMRGSARFIRQTAVGKPSIHEIVRFFFAGFPRLDHLTPFPTGAVAGFNNVRCVDEFRLPGVTQLVADRRRIIGAGRSVSFHWFLRLHFEAVGLRRCCWSRGQHEYGLLVNRAVPVVADDQAFHVAEDAKCLSNFGFEV
jgi:hypothetical protein